VFLAISIDEPAVVVRRFAEENQMPFIILLDEDGKVSSDYRVNGIPATFFINRDGEIVVRYVGQMSPRMIEEGLGRIR
jgi:peroxiredoxin